MINNSQFNHSYNLQGGALDIKNSYLPEEKRQEIINTVFTDNKAQEKGGQIYFEGQGLILKKVNFWHFQIDFGKEYQNMNKKGIPTTYLDQFKFVTGIDAYLKIKQSFKQTFSPNVTIEDCQASSKWRENIQIDFDDEARTKYKREN